MEKYRKQLPPIATLIPFEAAVRHESITVAADELGLTQAAVSKQVKALEAHVGTQLFERRNRAVHLTRQGRELGMVISAGLSTIADAVSEMRRENTDTEIVLRCQLCEGLYWLMPRLSGFYQTHPNIPVRVSVSTEPIVDAKEHFDLALQTSGRDFGSCELLFMASDNVFPVCSPKYAEKTLARFELNSLPEHNLLHHRIHPQDWVDWDVWVARMDLQFRIGNQGSMYDSYPMMMQAVLEGHGIALGWYRTVEKYLESGELIRPFANAVSVPDNLSVYKPANRALNVEVAALLEWLKLELSSQEPS